MVRTTSLQNDGSSVGLVGLDRLAGLSLGYRWALTVAWYMPLLTYPSLSLADDFYQKLHFISKADD